MLSRPVFRLNLTGASPVSAPIPNPGPGFRNVVHHLHASGLAGAATALLVNLNTEGGPADVNYTTQGAVGTRLCVSESFGDTGVPCLKNTANLVTFTLEGGAGGTVKGHVIYSIERTT